MRMIPILLLASLALHVGCNKATTRARAASRMIAGATRVEVFLIDGRNDPPDPTPILPGDPTVSGYAILARGKDQGPEFVGLLTDILADERTYAEYSSPCFWPGVAFRLWKENECVDMVICFKCGNFYLGPPTDKPAMENASFTRSPNWPRLVQLAKIAFPDDKEIQALEEN